MIIFIYLATGIVSSDVCVPISLCESYRSGYYKCDNVDGSCIDVHNVDVKFIDITESYQITSIVGVSTTLTVTTGYMYQFTTLCKMANGRMDVKLQSHTEMTCHQGPQPTNSERVQILHTITEDQTEVTMVDISKTAGITSVQQTTDVNPMATTLSDDSSGLMHALILILTIFILLLVSVKYIKRIIFHLKSYTFRSVVNELPQIPSAVYRPTTVSLSTFDSIDHFYEEPVCTSSV